MRRRALFILFVIVSLSGMVEANPVLYGPNKNERALQTQLDQQREAIMQLSQQIQTLHERIGGMTTVIEGLSRSIGELQASKRAHTEGSGSLAVIEAKIARLESECSQKEMPRRKSGSGGHFRAESEKSVDPLAGKKRAVLYSEGVRLFQKHRYDEAKKHFAMTRKKGYKPAASTYYLGEIAYYTKNYNDAIFYFKKSAELYDKAGYIDTLLLHTAISLEKSGKREEAKAFYQTVIDGYPGKKSASIARKKIKKL